MNQHEANELAVRLYFAETEDSNDKARLLELWDELNRHAPIHAFVAAFRIATRELPRTNITSEGNENENDDHLSLYSDGDGNGSES